MMVIDLKLKVKIGLKNRETPYAIQDIITAPCDYIMTAQQLLWPYIGAWVLLRLPPIQFTLYMYTTAFCGQFSTLLWVAYSIVSALQQRYKT